MSLGGLGWNVTGALFSCLDTALKDNEELWACLMQENTTYNLI